MDGHGVTLSGLPAELLLQIFREVPDMSVLHLRAVRCSLLLLMAIFITHLERPALTDVLQIA